MRVTIVDPPSGWRYGFPRVYDVKEGESAREWFIRHGYPERDIELALNYSRYWEQED